MTPHSMSVGIEFVRPRVAAGFALSLKMRQSGFAMTEYRQSQANQKRHELSFRHPIRHAAASQSIELSRILTEACSVSIPQP